MGSSVNVPGANPAGANTYLQFNNAGVFGGTAGATTDGTNITSLNIKPASFGMLGSTSGTLTVSAPATITSHTIIFPAAIGSANQVLTISNAGTGQLAWSDVALTGITTSLNTASPNNTVNASRILASGGTTNQDLVLSPKGNGPIVAHLSDSTSTGGNKRGNYAVDFQLLRNAATQVASGTCAVALGQQNTSSGSNCFVAGFANTASGSAAFAAGSTNTASGDYAVALGGYGAAASGTSAIAAGSGNTASGNYSVVLGRESTASSHNSVALGYGAKSDVEGSITHSANSYGGLGRTQTIITNMVEATSDATPKALGTGGTTNYFVVQPDQTITFRMLVTGRRYSGGTNVCSYEFVGCITNEAGTTTMNAVSKTVIYESDAAFDCDVTADNANDALIVTVTGLAGQNILWSASIFAGAVKNI